VLFCFYYLFDYFFLWLLNFRFYVNWLGSSGTNNWCVWFEGLETSRSIGLISELTIWLVGRIAVRNIAWSSRVAIVRRSSRIWDVWSVI